MGSVFNGKRLQRAPRGCVMPGGGAAQLAAQDQRFGVRAGCGPRREQAVGMGIVQLPDLLAQAHAGEKVVDEARLVLRHVAWVPAWSSWQRV
jgi:hypothetical protein